MGCINHDEPVIAENMNDKNRITRSLDCLFNDYKGFGKLMKQ